jgi:excisionase family DNA binding protein
MTDDPRYVGTKIAAEMLNTYQKHIRRLIKRGELEAFQSEGARGFNVSIESIEAYKRRQADKGE